MVVLRLSRKRMCLIGQFRFDMIPRSFFHVAIKPCAFLEQDYVLQINSCCHDDFGRLF